MGIGQTSSTSSLAITYTTQGTAVTGGVGTLTVTNNGSRPASYLATLSATANPTTTGILAATAATVWPVSSAASCTLGASTTGVAPIASGSLGSALSLDSGTTTIAAGASVILCVRTTMSASDIDNKGPGTVVLSVQTTLRYSSSAGWSTSAAAVTVNQSIVSTTAPDFFSNFAGRYNIEQKNPGGQWSCVNEQAPPNPRRLNGNSSCSQNYTDQWRLMPSSTANQWFIQWAQNAGSNQTPSEPRWNYTDASTAIATASSNDAASGQRWYIEARGDGTYRIRSVVDATKCLGSGSGGGNGTLIVPVSCDNSQNDQAFRFTLIQTPYPASGTYWALNCSNLGWTEQFTWQQSQNYQQEVRYEVHFGSDVAKQMYTASIGYNPVANLRSDGSVQDNQYDVDMNAYWTAHPPTSGNTKTVAVTIWESVAGSPWIQITSSRSLQITRSSSTSWTYSCS